MKKKIHIPSELYDFRNFVWLVWKHIGLPEPTPLQYDMAERIQHGPSRDIIEAFRGAAKSYLTSAFVCFELLHDPDKKFLVVSASKARADDFSTFTLRLISEMPILRHLQPKDTQRFSKVAFDVGPAVAAHSPSVKSLGITGMMTGSRADIVIADDVESLNNSLTQGNRDKIAETVKEFESILKPGGRILYLGTPQCEMSLYNSLQERGYQIRIWPARYPSEAQRMAYGGKLAPNLVSAVLADPALAGKSTDPKRFSDLDLSEREASYGRSSFNLQFMLDTTLSDQDRYPLKLRDLVTMPLDAVLPGKVVWGPDNETMVRELPALGLAGDRFYRARTTLEGFHQPAGTVMAIDPSGRGKDETAFAIVSLLNGQLFLRASGGFNQGYTPETLSSLAMVAKLHGVNRVLVESNFGDGMFSQLLRPVFARIFPATIEEVRHSIQKEKRIIDTLEPILNQHRLVVDAGVVSRDYAQTAEEPQRGLFYQLTRMTREKGALMCDDRIDALAMAVGYWVASLAQGVDEAVSAMKDDLLQAELDKFMESVTGRRTSEGWGKIYHSLK
jgi:hypothetical protein